MRPSKAKTITGVVVTGIHGLFSVAGIEFFRSSASVMSKKEGSHTVPIDRDAATIMAMDDVR